MKYSSNLAYLFFIEKFFNLLSPPDTQISSTGKSPLSDEVEVGDCDLEQGLNLDSNLIDLNLSIFRFSRGAFRPFVACKGLTLLDLGVILVPVTFFGDQNTS